MTARPIARTIQRGHSYRLRDFQELAGLGYYAMQEVTKAGLPLRKVGRRRYVTGDDWLDFLATRPAA